MSSRSSDGLLSRLSSRQMSWAVLLAGVLLYRNQPPAYRKGRHGRKML
jgi:hypothetical protein